MKKIKSIPLKVSAPFHCSLMKPAAEIMKDKLENTNFKNPILKLLTMLLQTQKLTQKILKNY